MSVFKGVLGAIDILFDSLKVQLNHFMDYYSLIENSNHALA